MDRNLERLLDVWRATGRLQDLVDVLDRVVDLFASDLPPSVLEIWRLDVEEPGLVLAARVPRRPESGPSRQALTAGQVRRLERWLASGRVFAWTPADPRGPLGDLLLPAAATNHLVGPLAAQGARGFLRVAAASTHHFDPGHRTIVEQLLEPLGAVLARDRHWRELRALREAAEADRRSLLARLKRPGVRDRIVGAEAGLRPVLARVELVARSVLPVLLLGETGSGKEVVARAVHEQSGRSEAPFIRVNCGAIAPELIDSELFGHEAGAFTGATGRRRGWFERADTGSLFLDEIGDLPLPAQVRLLRVLQDGTFERVGGEASVRVDVRVIAATHRDLAAMVQAGRFREDLWYRIASFPIVIPPLRERRQDIAPLAEHFTRRAAARFGLRWQPPTPQDLARLVAYDWPGNVREFAAVIDRAVILGEGDGLALEHALGQERFGRSAGGPAHGQGTPPAAEPLVTLDEAMRRHIAAALAATRGRIEGEGGAAALLDINPHTLRSRMRRLDLDWRRYRA